MYGSNGSWVPIKEASNITSNSVTLYLAPDSIHCFTIMANMNDNSISIISNNLAVDMPAIKTSDNSDEAKNAQLLYLAQAINKTKASDEEVTVEYSAKTNSTIDYLKNTIWFLTLIPGEYNGVDEVNSFFKTIDPDTKAEETEILNENIVFTNGVGRDSKNRMVNLQTFIEPSTSKDGLYLAYIYGGNSPANWKNGFSSVATTALSGGGYEITATLKSEKISANSTPLYHSGLCESVSTITQATGDGIDITDASVGNTVIKAKINKNGTLDSYSISSPFDCNLSMNMADMGITVSGSITMHMTGKNETSYIFTR